jgi:3-oxoacyl-[acyl-carrier protein] reductase
MLKGKIVLITGAGRGIGKATATLCAENGAQVIINYFKSEKDAIELGETLSRKGLKTTLIQGDISSEEDIKKIFLLIKNEFGRIDVIINNAGVALSNPIMFVTNEEFERSIAVNCKGIFLCTKYFVKMMMKQKSGKIINISSVFGIHGSPGQVIYSGSKAFVIGFTKAAAKELGRYGITVNAVAPGFIETDLIKNMSKEMTEKNLRNNSLGRIGTPEDVAKVVLFLSSDLSNYITGQVIRVDGGQII